MTSKDIPLGIDYIIERQYRTVKPPKALRALSRFRLIPRKYGRKIVFADTGFQVSPAIDYDTVLNNWHNVEDKLKVTEKKLEEELSQNNTKISELKTTIRCTDRELKRNKEEFRQSLEEKDLKIQSLQSANKKLKAENEKLVLAEETKLSKISFLEDECEYMQNALKEEHKMVSDLKAKTSQLESEKKTLQADLLEHKIKSSENLGHYIDELEEATAEKIALLKACGKTKYMRNILNSTERTKELEKQRNYLASQVEMYSTKMVAHEIDNEDLVQQVKDLTKQVEQLHLKNPTEPQKSISGGDAATSYQSLANQVAISARRKTFVQNFEDTSPGLATSTKAYQTTSTPGHVRE